MSESVADVGFFLAETQSFRGLKALLEDRRRPGWDCLRRDASGPNWRKLWSWQLCR